MTATLVYGDREPWSGAAAAEGEELWLSLADVEAATGWTPRPEGLCRGDVCVPLRGERLGVRAFAELLGQPVVHEDDVWVVGVAARERVVSDGVAPDFTLPDADGRLHSLSQHRGNKVLLAAWASW